MLKFFTNRQLAVKFGLPLAKLKRWSREFLPPDPLGGLQSGVARQYSVDQAWILFLGAHLVAELKAGIPEAKRILEDLTPFFKDAGVFANAPVRNHYRLGDSGKLPLFTVTISRMTAARVDSGPLCYTIRAEISRETDRQAERAVHQVRYLEEHIPPSSSSGTEGATAKVLRLSMMVERFAKSLGLDLALFPILNNHKKRTSPADRANLGSATQDDVPDY